MTEEDPSPFNPINDGFVLLEGHQPPWKVRYFEFQNHPCVDGTHDYHRLNLYLTQDGEFVTIWQGCLEPMAIDVLFRDNGIDPVVYDEPLFRGYIGSEEQARYLLRALRPLGSIPQVLKINREKSVVCETLQEKGVQQ